MVETDAAKPSRHDSKHKIEFPLSATDAIHKRLSRMIGREGQDYAESANTLCDQLDELICAIATDIGNTRKSDTERRHKAVQKIIRTPHRSTKCPLTFLG
jgi:hypothetical protein